MTEAWTPELHLRIHGNHCRLTLAGLTYGNGLTLQEAGQDLIARVLDLALGLRAGYQVTSVAQADARVVEFLWEIGELAIRGEDVWRRVFASSPNLPAR
ncbi:hypothetical protein [Catelliglobosispora koreensis]|uniref:hypothetical protein n=1 Tax=Catelliglobosispora koreensis TaxID=129052 RepID=UPI000380C8F2|nr:hypothetical protein [Catelliglobosispora koreensis]